MLESPASPALPWVVYGATGTTGRLVVTEALRRGQRPILAGRDPTALRELAEPLGLEWAAVPLDHRAELEALLRRSSRVLLAAGPFRSTTPPMLDACLATGTPYLDVSGELDVLAATLARDADARRAGIPIVAGAGFAVTAGDCLAAYVARRRPGARQLRLGLNAQNDGQSTGALASRLDVLGGGGAWLEGGELRRGRAAHARFRATIDGRTRVFVAAPLADLVAAQRTGIPNVIAGVPAPPWLAPVLGWLMPLLVGLARLPAVRRFVERRALRRRAPRAAAASAAPRRSFVWAEATDAQGTSAALLELGEGYRFAASALVRAAERLTEEPRAGAFTPAAAFGPDFVLELPGVSRRDLTPLEARELEVPARVAV